MGQMLEHEVAEHEIEAGGIKRQGLVGLDNIGLVKLMVIQNNRIDVRADNYRCLTAQVAFGLPCRGTGTQIKHHAVRVDISTDPAIESARAIFGVAGVSRIKAVHKL